MIKVGYFTHSAVSISETFIYDLIKGLEKEFDLTFYSGEKYIHNNITNRQVATSYAVSAGNKPYYIYKLGQLVGGRGISFKGKTFQFYADKSLNRHVDKNIDVAYVDYSTSGVLLMDFFERNDIPFVVHVHGYDITSATNDKYYLSRLKELFNKATYFIAASFYMKRLLVLLGCDESKIKVIRLGIDGESIIPKLWKERVKTEPRVVFLGRLTRKKHPIALLHAFKLLVRKFQMQN